MTERVACRTPNPDKPGVTNVPAWKFDACRRALLAEAGPEPRKAAEIVEGAKARLSEEERGAMGSLGWHLTTVRLELEVRGELTRLPGAPVRLSLSDPAEGPAR